MKENCASLFFDFQKSGNQCLTIRPKLKQQRPTMHIVQSMVRNHNNFCELDDIKGKSRTSQSLKVKESYLVESKSQQTTAAQISVSTQDMTSALEVDVKFSQQMVPNSKTLIQTRPKSSMLYQFTELHERINELREFINKQVYERMQQMHRIFRQGNQKSIHLIMIIVKKLEQENAQLKQQLIKYKTEKLQQSQVRDIARMQPMPINCACEQQTQQQYSPIQQIPDANTGIPQFVNLREHLQTIQEMDSDDEDLTLRTQFGNDYDHEYYQSQHINNEKLQQYSSSKIVNKILKLKPMRQHQFVHKSQNNHNLLQKQQEIKNKMQSSFQNITLLSHTQSETQDSIEMALSIFKMYNRSAQEQQNNQVPSYRDKAVHTSQRQITNKNKQQKFSQVKNKEVMATKITSQANSIVKNPQKENKIKQIISRSARNHNHKQKQNPQRFA